MERLSLTANLEAVPSPTARRIYRARLYRIDVPTRDSRQLRFAAGALSEDQENVPLLFAHLSGNPIQEPVVIGGTTRLWEADGSAWADFRFARTEKAREVEQLVIDGALSKVSVGVALDETTVDDETDDLVVLAYDLYELSIVPIPAMRDAGLVDTAPDRQLVRLAQKGAPMPESTPAAPTPVNGEVLTLDVPAEPPRPDLDARLTALEDQIRDQAATSPTVRARSREPRYQTFGHLITDVVAMDRNRDAQATERLAPLIEAGRVRTDGPARIVDLAFADVGGPGDTQPQTGYVPELLELLHNGRVAASFFAQRDLDEVPGSVVDLPKVTVGGLVDYQTPGGPVANRAQVWDKDTFPKATLAGGQGVAVQARDWSSPAYMDSVIRDLVEAYGEKVNFEAVAGNGAAGPPPHHKGITASAAAPIDGSAGPAALIAAIGTAKGNVFTATKQWPTTLLAAGATLGELDGMVGTDNRPLLATDGPANAIGTESGPSPAGRIRGLNAFADDGVPAGILIVTNFRDAQLWESGSAPVQVGLTYPDVLTIDVAVFGYSAVAIRRAGAFALIDIEGGVVLFAEEEPVEAKTTTKGK